jgi:hypothetical protein
MARMNISMADGSSNGIEIPSLIYSAQFLSKVGSRRTEDIPQIRWAVRGVLNRRSPR